MQAIANAIGLVLAKIGAALAWIGRLFVACFEAAWLMLQDLVCWGFDSALKLSTLILGAFDFSALTAQAGAWAGLPPQLLEVCSAVGLSQALGLVTTAIGIRLLLQLIPFTRLGS